jgi:hypothetical protein
MRALRFLIASAVLAVATPLLSQTINIVVVSTNGSPSMSQALQDTVNQLIANAPSGVTVNTEVVTSFSAASNFRANHASQTNYLVAHGLYDSNGTFTGELADTQSQVFGWDPKTVQEVSSYGFTMVYFCGMPDAPFNGYKISNHDIGGDIGQRHSITYDYEGKAWVEFCRAALLTCPGPSFYCSRWGYWGLTEEYADYTYLEILAGAHPDGGAVFP